MDGDIMSLVSANQRPVSGSRDHSRPIRGQYPEERQLPALEFLPIVATAALSLTIGLSDNSCDNSDDNSDDNFRDIFCDNSDE